MKLLFICLLYTCLIVFSAADDSLVQPERKIYIPFRQRTLMTPAWKYVKASASQEKRDHLLFEFARIPCSDQEYYKRRTEIAAAIFAGASVTQVQKQLQQISCQGLLPPVVLKGDIALTHLLLMNGADVNELDLKGERAIYHAKTVDMAILLIKHKALDNLHDAEKLRIFQCIMWSDYDSGLIRLYKGHGFNPVLWKNSWLILRSLVCNPHQDLVKKVELIFDKVSCENVLKIICGKKVGPSKTIFEEIEYRQEKAQPNVRAQLTKLYRLLSDLIECPICLGHMNVRSYAKTSCGHMFHATCLQDWKEQCAGSSHGRCMDCPTCRQVM